DEPTAALDLRHQEDVLRLARELAAEGRAVVIVLHDLSLAAAYADEIAILHEGSLQAIGAPADVLTAERVERVYGTAVRILDDPDTGRPVVLPRRRR
ncbi:MAG: hemin transporter ATP-binding protein, partial [Microbacterium sp.]|nr:hemin transporter ATP-binding protein [Microbacterium sp.]